MPQTILEGVIGRTEHLWSLTDPAKGDQGSPVFLLDITEGLRKGVLLRDYLAEAFKLQWKEVFDNQVEDYNSTGQLCLVAFDAALRAFKVVQQRAETVSAKAVGQDISPQFGEAMEAFKQARVDVEELKGYFLKHWPWFDQAKLDKSIAAERQGARRYSIKEVRDELRRRV